MQNTSDTFEDIRGPNHLSTIMSGCALCFHSFAGINPSTGSKTATAEVVSKKSGKVVEKKRHTINVHVCTLLRKIMDFEQLYASASWANILLIFVNCDLLKKVWFVTGVDSFFVFLHFKCLKMIQYALKLTYC